MQLNDALADIAGKFNLDAQALIDYAAEDTIGGWDNGGGGWPNGSLWSVEGKVLYALVRALKPSLCLEIGTWYGCSASHIAAALKANGSGTLFCVDNGGFGKVQIAPELLPFIEFRNTDLLTFVDLYTVVDSVPNQFDFIFEDALHEETQVRAVWSAAKDGLLKPGGMIVSHDAMHFIVGDDVQRGIALSGVTGVQSYLIAPSDCGLAVYRMDDMPAYKQAFNGTPEEFLDALNETLERGEQLIIEKPKRKPRKKAAVKAGK